MPTISLDQLSGNFRDMAQRATDLTPVTRVGGIMGEAEVKNRFSTQIDPFGNPWAALRFGRPEGGNIPLRNHGLLMASYTNEYGRDFWRVGTNLKHARLMHFGGTVVPVNKQWLTIPLTRQAVYAGAAPRQPGLHFQLDRAGSAGLYDSTGTKHWHLTKMVTVPARPMVGVSSELMDKWLGILTHYLSTGEL